MCTVIAKASCQRPCVLVPGNTIPPDVRIADVRAAGASGFVLCALGDPNSFLPIKVDPYKSVLKELEIARKAVVEAKGIIVADPAGLESAAASVAGVAALAQPASVQPAPAFLPGIEGGDFIGEDADRIDHVFGLGVRLLGLVHYSKNRIGSISYGWGGKIIPDSERTGLSAFGKTVIARANGYGMIIDLAHADDETIKGALAASTAPMICSHTGPRSPPGLPALHPRRSHAGNRPGGRTYRPMALFQRRIGHSRPSKPSPSTRPTAPTSSALIISR